MPDSARITVTFLLALLASNAHAGDNALEFNIPAQNLPAALKQLAGQSRLQMLYDGPTVQGKHSTALKGRYTPRQALQQVLAGTGLRAVATGNNAVAVKSEPQSYSGNAGSDTTLPKVTVEADSAYDPEYYADPYNKDYVLPNATVGTKTDTPVMETPLNVQVISKQVLKDRQVIRLADSFKNVSGVVTTTNSRSTGVFGGTAQSIFMRGFESQFFMRNGFRLQQGSASRELANVESVEVLKGPAAILYGLVEPGGMVNVVTKQPLATPYYGFTQQFGSYDLYRTTFDASGPLTKNKDLLYRANLSYENSGSFRDYVGREDVYFAPVLRWNISPQTQITFEMEYNHLHQGLDNAFIPAIPGLNLNVPINRNYGSYSPATTETIFGGFNWSHQFNDDWILKHRFSVNQQSLIAPSSSRPQIARSNAEILTQFGDVLPDGSYVYRDNWSANTQDNTTSTNLDLVGHFDTVGLKHTLLVGGDYYGLDSSNNTGVSAGHSYVSLTNPVEPGLDFGSTSSFETEGPQSFHTDQYGLYIQDQIKLPFDVHVTGGIRYQYIHQSTSSTPSALIGGDGTTITSSTPAQDAVTPRVGILWHPKNWLSLYANYAESFGVNTGLTFVREGVGKIIDPTSAAQYEGGVKFEFFDGKLRANLTYYDLTKTNIAVGDPNPSHNCGTGFIPGTASNCQIALGEVRSRGPEIDIQGEILPGWNVIATWSNTDIRVTKANPANKDEPVGSGDSGNSYRLGSRLANIPRNTGSIWSTYEVQSGDYKGLSFGGGVTLRDGQIVPDGFGAEPSKLPGYATFDLMAGYSRQVGDAKVSVQFNVNNLLDKQYFSSRTNNTNGQGAWVDLGQPRTFMGQVSVQY
jgi:iron complex outermembrane recepter protein